MFSVCFIGTKEDGMRVGHVIVVNGNHKIDWDFEDEIGLIMNLSAINHCIGFEKRCCAVTEGIILYVKTAEKRSKKP